MESAAALLAANSTRSEGTRRALEAELSKARAERAASCEQARKTAHLPFFVQEHYKPRPPPSKLYAWSFGAYADPATGGLRGRGARKRRALAAASVTCDGACEQMKSAPSVEPSGSGWDAG